MSENTSPRFLTVAEVADMCRVSRMTVYRWVHNGDLPAVRFGKSFRVPEQAAAEFVQRAALTSDVDEDGGTGVTAVG
ncbi:MAG: helix-turn-helix domain-containing protein [Demequina sp.]|uniref:helix-turn-helix domain-containing protein n=1 Tax=Demequina sp. TaxID=2050685 RepID=UPI0019AFC3AE|nr:helix-turn-helix domain-containing protein [Demequina sp.]MBC7298130.1 helix-turn-helix domain-containing protein [Demequina sp.]